MLIDLRSVAPGDLSNEVFEEFVAGNSYGPEMVEALRDHLVNGLDVKTAIKDRAVHAHKFKMRLDKLNEEIQRVGRINSLLSVDQQRMDRVFSLATELASAVDEIRSNATPSNAAGRSRE